MIWTNRLNLSPDIYNAIVERQEQYDLTRDGYSATTLLGAPRYAHLLKRHHEQAEQDVADSLDSWIGHLMHDALEKDATSMRIDTDEFADVVNGAFDYYKDGVLKDYKYTGTFSVTVKEKETKDKWEQQLNIYAYLIRSVMDMPVEQMFIEVFLKDWSPGKAEFDRHYPQQKQYRVPIRIWDNTEAYKFLQERTAIMASHVDTPDDKLPKCTMSEKWQDPPKFKVYRNKNKRSSRNLDTLREAEEYVESQKVPEEYRIEEFLSVARKCPKCAVNKFCNQYREEQG